MKCTGQDQNSGQLNWKTRRASTLTALMMRSKGLSLHMGYILFLSQSQKFELPTFYVANMFLNWYDIMRLIDADLK